MACELRRATWPAAVGEGLVFALVLGVCLATHYQEHNFSVQRWLRDVVAVGFLPGLVLAVAVAIPSLAWSAGVTVVLLSLFLLGPAAWDVFHHGLLNVEPLWINSSLALTAFGLGRLLRPRSGQRWQFDLRTLFWLPFMLAALAGLVWRREPSLLIALGVALAAALTARAGSRLTFAPPATSKARWWLAVGLTLGCLYLPFAWLLLIDHPWNSYRLTLLAVSLLLPGAIPFATAAAFVTGLPAWLTAPWCLGGTVLLWGVVSWLAQRGRWATVVAVLLGLGMGGYSAFAVHAIFRA